MADGFARRSGSDEIFDLSKKLFPCYGTLNVLEGHERSPNTDCFRPCAAVFTHRVEDCPTSEPSSAPPRSLVPELDHHPRAWSPGAMPSRRASTQRFLPWSRPRLHIRAGRVRTRCIRWLFFRRYRRISLVQPRLFQNTTKRLRRDVSPRHVQQPLPSHASADARIAGDSPRCFTNRHPSASTSLMMSRIFIAYQKVVRALTSNSPNISNASETPATPPHTAPRRCLERHAQCAEAALDRCRNAARLQPARPARIDPTPPPPRRPAGTTER